MRAVWRASFGLPFAHALLQASFDDGFPIVDGDREGMALSCIGGEIQQLSKNWHKAAAAAEEGGMHTSDSFHGVSSCHASRLSWNTSATDQTATAASWESNTEGSSEKRPRLADAVSNVMNRYGGNSQAWHGYEKAASLAEEYREELQLLTRMLHERGISLPDNRFSSNNAELMRFAYTTGLTVARSSAERLDAIQLAAERIAETTQWLQGRQFSSDEELRHWQPLLEWAEVKDEPHPVLRIEIGQATRQCKGEELIDFAEAIISQVEAAVQTKFSDQEGCPEQMIVVAHCSGADSLQSSYLFKLIKHVSLALNKHYPGRLHQFYLVGVPKLLRWPVKAVIALGHPSTRQKIVLCDPDDSRLPIP